MLDTRKTTPTLRALEKYAVRAGGATNHRVGLFDAVLIKDNHIRAGRRCRRRRWRTRARRQPGLPIEVEARDARRRSTRRSRPAPTSILVDNMSIARHSRSGRAHARGRAKIEISGGVTLDRMPELAATGADFVSVGALTHSAPAIDISFEIEPPDRAVLEAPTGRRAEFADAPSIAPRARLGRLGRRVRATSPTIGSTNDVAAAWRPIGDAEGAVVVADEQTAGRGRRGQTWFSPPGSGLYVSVVLTPAAPAIEPRRGHELLDARRRRRAGRRHRGGDGTARRSQVAERSLSSAGGSWPASSPKAAPALSCARATASTSADGVSARACATARRRSNPSWGARRSRDAVRRNARRAGTPLRRPARRPVRCYSRRVARARAGQPGRARRVDDARRRAGRQ